MAMTPYNVYRGPYEPPLTRWQTLSGWTIIWSAFFVVLLVWIAGALITGDGDWPDRVFRTR